MDTADNVQGGERCVQVLQAAEKCFREYGFHATSIQRISDVAGMSPGHIYHYFRNKEAIVAGIVEHRLAAVLEHVELVRQNSQTTGVVEAWIAQIETGMASCINREQTPIDLEILAERIQTVQENITRFFLITRRGPRRPKPPSIKRPRYGKKTSLVCAVDNEPGALFRLLKCFEEFGVNLTKLESRPRRDPPWEYLFYLDLDGGRSEKPIAASLRAARRATTFLQVLGTYTRALPPSAPPKRRSRKRRSPAEP